MRTRSSSNLVGESSPNTTTSNPKRRNSRRQSTLFFLEDSTLDTMADQRTMAELLCSPTKGYPEAIMVPPILAEHFELKHSLINMMTLDQFFGLEKDNPHITFVADQDSLNSAAGGNLLERRTQDVLTIIENKSKQTSVVTTAMTAILKQFQATPPPASVKSIEETFVTCGGAHPYYRCLAADGNTFPEFRDNIQGYISAAAINHEYETWHFKLLKPTSQRINQHDNDSYEDYLKDLFATNHLSGNPTFSSHTDLTSPKVINPLSGNTTSSSHEHWLEEFADELALITFPLRNDDLLFDIEFNLREIEYLLNHDSTKEIDSILEDSVDEGNLEDPNKDLVDTFLEMFTDEHTLDYSSPPLYDDVDDDLVDLSSIMMISSDFLPSPECDSVLYEDFSKVIALHSTNNEDKISISNASLILEDFNPPLYELPFHREVPGSETLLSFSSINKGKVFNPWILTSKGVHTSLLSELSHQDLKALKVIKIFESSMEIFTCSYGEDICILDVPCLHFYPNEQLNSRDGSSLVTLNKRFDFLDFEDSCSWFCPSITRSSHPQLHLGNPIS
nr:hypothetical protein [Tanacetum cinerariifolium]